MKKQIVAIHGGDTFEKYEDYIADLKNKAITLDRLLSRDWKANLQNDLGEDYEVILPRMPNPNNARYAEWKIVFDKIVPLLDDEIIFIGHSLGGIFLAKYLSEESVPKKITAVFLVAAPYNTGSEWDRNTDFVLPHDLSEFSHQVPHIFIYHSKDDPVVPFSDCLEYQKALPKAQVKTFEDRQHFNQENLPEIVDNIKALNQ